MINAFIVEDMAVSRAALESIMEANGYNVVGSTAKAELALQLLPQSKADILLLDINLAGRESGIWLAAEIRKLMQIPIIYLTAYGDKETLDQLKTTRPDGYLMKPYNEPTLLTTMSIALEKYRPNISQEKFLTHAQPALPPDNFIFVKENNQLKKINKAEILYVQSEGNYLRIVLANKYYLVRRKLNDFLEKLQDARFIQVHRRFIVNRLHIDAFCSENITIQSVHINISRTYRHVIDQLG